MRHGSLFSGIGGFDLVAEWMGWENMFHCEINEFCQKILKYHFPNSTGYADIKTTDFSIWSGRIDVLTGGFPCQPFSAAGKRKGKEDNRYLWPEMLRAIGEIQPRWIVGENVHGIVNWSRGMVFEQVQADLEDQGYDTQAYVLPACSKDAPHKRERVWFIANSNGSRYDTANRTEKGNVEREECKSTQQSDEGRWCENSGFNDEQPVTNPNNNGCNGKYEINASERGQYALNDIEQTITSNTAKSGLERSIGEELQKKRSVFTRNNWNKFPTQSPICSRNDGIRTELSGITLPKHRTESIKAYGNAIVPQVAYEIFKAIQQYENEYAK